MYQLVAVLEDEWDSNSKDDIQSSEWDSSRYDIQWWDSFGDDIQCMGQL